MNTVLLTVLITVFVVHLLNIVFLVLADEFGWPDDAFQWMATFTVGIPLYWLYVKPTRAIRKALRNKAKGKGEETDAEA